MIGSEQTDVVTGAFGYTGRYVTQLLLDMGRSVVTLTGHADRQNPFGGRVKALPFDFDNPRRLADHLRDTTTLYITYWIRFPYKGMTYEKAVENTFRLIEAAEKAAVKRLVYVSITKADKTSPFPYFAGKGRIEEKIEKSGLSYGIVRPTVIFGDGGILINNIAWLLRRLPLFGVFGSGGYKIQPIYVEDMARIMVEAGQSNENKITDAVGPETYTFAVLVKLIAVMINSPAKIIPISPKLGLLMGKIIGPLLGDVLITKDEINGLMANLLYSNNPPTGTTRLSQWVKRNASSLGEYYFGELKKHYR